MQTRRNVVPFAVIIGIGAAAYGVLFPAAATVRRALFATHRHLEELHVAPVR